MNIGAVVCEYNPFHFGHKKQLDIAREALGLDAIIGMMSGNFVQRGEPAIFPKHLRARAAINSGMDLVLELPAVLTLQSAERYARNAIATLDAMGCVSTLFFGAETPDTDLLMSIAQVLASEDDTFKNCLRRALDEGNSFAAARAEAVRQIIGEASAEILSKPNNILAVEYLKAIINLKSSIRPVALLRDGASHDSSSIIGNSASASAIRQIIHSGDSFENFVPESAYEIFKDAVPFRMNSMEKAILAKICLMTPMELENIIDVGEGLENAICREVQVADTMERLCDSVKSKRYAYSRLRRILLCAYLGITKSDASLSPSYIRILDFNEVGQGVLNMAKKTATLPLAKNGGQIKDNPEALKLWQRELSIDKVYRLFQG